MKRATVFLVIIFWFLPTLSCTSKLRAALRELKCRFDSLKRIKEDKSPGDTGYMLMQPGPGKELMAIEISWPKDSMLLFGGQGFKAKVDDAKGEAYDSIYQEAFGPKPEIGALAFSSKFQSTRLCPNSC